MVTRGGGGGTGKRRKYKGEKQNSANSMIRDE
jgi:hypothetical protein